MDSWPQDEQSKRVVVERVKERFLIRPELYKTRLGYSKKNIVENEAGMRGLGI